MSGAEEPNGARLNVQRAREIDTAELRHFAEISAAAQRPKWWWRALLWPLQLLGIAARGAWVLLCRLGGALLGGLGRIAGRRPGGQPAIPAQPVPPASPLRRLLALLRAALVLATLVLALGLVYFAIEWIALPNGKETLALARSVHIYLKKETQPDGRVVTHDLADHYGYHFRLDRFATPLKQAVIASEDWRFPNSGELGESFYEYGWVYKLANFAQAAGDCPLIKLGNLVNAKPRKCPGGSTISQQVARMLLYSQHRSLRRKVLELIWGLKMDAQLSKEEILEIYLNRVPLGNRTFGVEMGARFYFGKHAGELTLNESVLLAAAVNKPEEWNCLKEARGAEGRARTLLKKMIEHGYLDAQAAAIEPRFPERCGKGEPNAPYLGHFKQWLAQEIDPLLATLPDGDYKLITSLDAEMQIYAERALEAGVGKEPLITQGALVAMDPQSGAVRAMVGGVGEERGRSFNRADRPDHLEERPPASTFKPILFLAALEAGLPPDTRIDASRIAIKMPHGKPPYRPRNFENKVYGKVTLREAIVHSINTAAVRLLKEQVGLEPVRRLARRLGIDTLGSNDPDQWSLALGTVPTPLTQMVGAYGAFANGGRLVRPHGLLAIYGREGGTVWERPPPPDEPVADAGKVRDLNAMLGEALTQGTGTAALKGLAQGGGRLFAGKTGTGEERRDLWFIGYSSRLVAGVWLGNDEPRDIPDKTGGNAAAPVWREFIDSLQRNTRLLDDLEPLY